MELLVLSTVRQVFDANGIEMGASISGRGLRKNTAGLVCAQARLDAVPPPIASDEMNRLERENAARELLEEKSRRLDRIVEKFKSPLNRVGVEIRLIESQQATEHFRHAEGYLLIKDGAAFLHYLSSLTAGDLNAEQCEGCVSVLEDSLSFLRFHRDLTDPTDENAIQLIAHLNDIGTEIRRLEDLGEPDLPSQIERYGSYLPYRCLRDIILLERCGAVDPSGSLRYRAIKLCQCPYLPRFGAAKSAALSIRQRIGASLLGQANQEPQIGRRPNSTSSLRDDVLFVRTDLSGPFCWGWDAFRAPF